MSRFSIPDWWWPQVEQEKEALQAYAVYPLHLEKVTNQLFRVEDGKQTYALKRTTLTDETLKNWELVYQYAYSHNLTAVLPVYLTREGKLYTKTGQSVYYLTPWIHENENRSDQQIIEQIYHTIGSLHGKTKQSHLVQTDQFKQQFRTYQTFCSETKDRLLEYVKVFERSRYMSPFELLVCTQYRDLELALNIADKRIEQFLEEDDEQFAWNDSLCHGNLSRFHTVNSYLINWEQSHQDNAVMDLVHFFQQEAAEYGPIADLLIELFPAYMKENELTLKEHYLLTMYLLNPTPYIAKVQAYSVKSSDYNMVDQIKHLQHEYRKINFGLAWSDYVEKEHESNFSMDDLES